MEEYTPHPWKDIGRRLGIWVSLGVGTVFNIESELMYERLELQVPRVLLTAQAFLTGCYR